MNNVTKFTTSSHEPSNVANQTPPTQIRVIVRKRPLNKKEVDKCYDIASCLCAKNGQRVVIHEPKARDVFFVLSARALLLMQMWSI